MFDKSIFEVLTFFFIAILTFLCVGSKDKSDPNSNRGKGRGAHLAQPKGAANKEPSRAMMETKRIDIPVGKSAMMVENAAKEKEKEKEKVVKEQPSKKKVEPVEQKTVDKVKSEPNDNNKTLLDVDPSLCVLQASALPKLDKTVSENIHTPAVHERANRIAVDRLIIDPKHTQYGGNIDMLPEEEKQKKLTQIEHDLENHKTEKSSEASRKTKDRRVKIREDKCLLFETNEAPTDDEEEEVVQGELN